LVGLLDIAMDTILIAKVIDGGDSYLLIIIPNEDIFNFHLSFDLFQYLLEEYKQIKIISKTHCNGYLKSAIKRHDTECKGVTISYLRKNEIKEPKNRQHYFSYDTIVNPKYILYRLQDPREKSKQELNRIQKEIGNSIAESFQRVPKAQPHFDADFHDRNRT